MRYATAAALLLLALLPRPLPAQRGELTPELALALLAEVQTTHLNGEGQPETPLPAAGTVVGMRNDTVYVVTAKHHVRDVDRVRVRLTPRGPLLPAAVRVAASDMDFALLAVTGHAGDPAWSAPARAARAVRDVGSRELVYVIGCPAGRCWVPPEQGVMSEVEDTTLLFRTLYVKPGNSGGPLVDVHGALLGMVVSHGVAEATAIRWDVIEASVRRWGVPVNLAEERGYRVGEHSVRIFGAVFPRPGLNSDGRRLFPGARLEVAGRIAPRLELVGGFSHVSLATAPLDDPQADWEEAYAHDYYFAGVRSSHPVTPWSLGRGLPDVVSGGIDLLVPVSPSAPAVRMAATDSVDLSRGEYVQARKAVYVPAGLAVALRASYRVALGERLGVIASPSFYLLNFNRFLGTPHHGVLEIGADYRTP